MTITPVLQYSSGKVTPVPARHSRWGASLPVHALQGGAIPDGGYWLPLKFGIVKFSHVSVQQDVCIQIQEPVILGKQAGSQKADVGQGGKSAAIPVLEGLEQFFRERGKMN